MFGRALEAPTGLRVSGTECVRQAQPGEKTHQAEWGEIHIPTS